MNYRVLVAVGISLAIHGLPIWIVYLYPSQSFTTSISHSGGGQLLRVRVEGWSRPDFILRPKSPPRGEEYIPVDVQPTLSLAPVLHKAESTTPLASVIPTTPGTGPVSGIVSAQANDGTGLIQPPNWARRVIFVVDCSVSMGLSGGLQRARSELRIALRRLSPEAEFQVIGYNQSVRSLFPVGWTLASSQAIEQAIDRLDDLRAEGRTNHLKALRSALYHRPDVLFVVTDADDLDEVEATRLHVGRTVIHAIELRRGAGHGEGPLAKLARRSGGIYRRVAALP
ncbi:MAG: VWA domain-containing protein [Planctomycetia bacterium]|nr:VWA domain-containing protein [Planctomycetia bacterium]